MLREGDSPSRPRRLPPQPPQQPPSLNSFEGGRRRVFLSLLFSGSGRLRRILYMATVRCIRLPGSAFGAYYHRLVARGMKKRGAMMAVKRKMLIVAYRLLRFALGFL